jgi:geranylgeranyl diphosphate synthase type II
MVASTDNQSPAQELRELVNQRLAVLIAETGSNDPLTSALRHSLLAPGKRVRPLICLMSAQCLGASYEAALDPACAIEMVHTASLIIDDLPSMDDAHMRRGRPACHQHFGEATAILAALELLSLGYRVMSAAPGVDSERRMQLVQILARAVGIKGLIGGQERDLAVVKDTQVGSMGTESVTRTHELKTSSLFIAAAESGATVAGLEGDQLVSICEFAARLGLAYQAMDDLLDVRGTVSTAGKDVGKDADKPTLVGVLGENEAAVYANNMLAGAMAALQPLGSGMQPLENLVQSMLTGGISSGSDVRH